MPHTKVTVNTSHGNDQQFFFRRDIPDREFMMAGSEINLRQNMTFITWCLLDDEDTPYDVLS